MDRWNWLSVSVEEEKVCNAEQEGKQFCISQEWFWLSKQEFFLQFPEEVCPLNPPYSALMALKFLVIYMHYIIMSDC